jgi:hypothetical protein
MKAEYDKEIDSLLRERARRGRGASAEPGAHAAAHLDADEQSAYAENALPAAARAHYAAHLADCDDCRRNVTRLALAAGIPAQLEPREIATGQAVSPDAGWRARLGALFAPRAWRYAVPALALLLVGAVSLVVLTRKTQRDVSIAERNTSSASNAQRPQQAQASQPETHHASLNDNAATTATPGESAVAAPDSKAAAPNPNAPLSKEEIAANNPRAEVEQPLAGAPLNSAAAPPPPAPVVGSGAGTRSVSELPTPEATPIPMNADELTITSDGAAKTGAAAQELSRLERKQGESENRQQYENQRREGISGPRRNEQARNQRAADADAPRDRDDKPGGYVAGTTAAPASPPAAATAAKRSRQPEAARGKDESGAADDSGRSAAGRKTSAADTRTVAGRKFRRQGNAWIDTAYSAGQSYTVVRRNSEQFRALIADEPELRRVADALGGEITVVWKGRAYRIR